MLTTVLSSVHQRNKLSEDFDLAEEWMNMVDKMPDQVSMPTADGRITDPFVVVSEG